MVLVRTTGLVGNSEVMVDYVITPVASEAPGRSSWLTNWNQMQEAQQKIHGRVRDVILFVNRRK